MTNTLNTPIEAMECDMPIRIDAYEFVAGAGGAGEFRGGCGLRRTFVLREGTATASLLVERHTVGPAGTNGAARVRAANIYSSKPPERGVRSWRRGASS